MESAGTTEGKGYYYTMDKTMYAVIKDSAARNPNAPAYSFFGDGASYSRFLKQIDDCARSLAAIGMTKDDSLTIALPNCPQCLIAFYAVNKIGAVANMVHPLSGEKEIEGFLNMGRSRFAITFDSFYGKFDAVRAGTPLQKVIVTSADDGLGFLKGFFYRLKNRSDVAVKKDDMMWSDFIKLGRNAADPAEDTDPESVRVILYSGGTTGATKGVMHTNRTFNALSAQIDDVIHMKMDKVMALMPAFHGFGLGVTMHTALMCGCELVLVPRFHPDEFVKTMLKKKTSIITGIPPMYDAIMSVDRMKNADLSFFRFIVSGGDTLAPEKQKEIDDFITSRGSPVRISPGYGLSEVIGSVCVDYGGKDPGSVGAPFSLTKIIIVDKDNKEVPAGTTGEICIRGPCVMKGYLDNPEETAEAMVRHADGEVWLHTGDAGFIDDQGCIHFMYRIKRLVIMNGYNVYPLQIEDVLYAHPSVKMCCAIGVPDARKGHHVKVFVVPSDGTAPSDDLRKQLNDYARLNISKYALPLEIEFRESLPLTKLGKVAYRMLEEESEAAQQGTGH